MLPTKFSDLPQRMQNPSVKFYYNLLLKKQGALRTKRLFDLVLSALLLALLSPVMAVVALAVVFDSEGGAVFRQERIAQYGRPFVIYKFRTMRPGAERGSGVTLPGDGRVTRIGGFLRKTRLDELPQLINVLLGDMSFVGPRPELLRYVRQYDDAALATLLVPQGITSPASLCFRNEERLLTGSSPERIYTELILPKKAALNLRYIERLSPLEDLCIMAETLLPPRWKTKYIDEIRDPR